MRSAGVKGALWFRYGEAPNPPGRPKNFKSTARKIERNPLSLLGFLEMISDLTGQQ
jgi:hypothetical protein